MYNLLGCKVDLQCHGLKPDLFFQRHDFKMMTKKASSREICLNLAFLHPVKHSDLFVFEFYLIVMWPTSRKAVPDFCGLGTGPFAGR